MSDFNGSPRLRTVEKIKPPFPLNQFPSDFGFKLGKEVIYILATKSPPDISGNVWEQIFALCIGADWKPSNVGLDDVLLGNCAWSAKSVTVNNLQNCLKVRLISGRNSPAFSFDQNDLSVDPQIIGNQVLKIWNTRVENVRSKYSHLRTVVLMKSKDLTKLAVFEFETVLYPIEKYVWRRNNNNNLQGYDFYSNEHKFTWQPHGSQFTIIEPVPQDYLIIEVETPPKLEKEHVLNVIGFDSSWIKVMRKKETFT